MTPRAASRNGVVAIAAALPSSNATAASPARVAAATHGR
jgi:hypothetical protein